MLNSTGNLGDIIGADWPANFPALIDFTDPDRPVSWTADALGDAADAVARGLIKQGCQRGDRVAILSAPSAYNVIAYLGIMRAGCVAAPMNHGLAQSMLSFMLQDCKAKLILADEKNRAFAAQQAPAFLLGAPDFGGLVDPGPYSVPNTEFADVAQILYTSGSTGRPKGVLLSHGGQLWSLSKMVRPRTAQERVLVAAPLYHMNGLLFCKVALMNHMQILLLPKFDAKTYLTIANQQRATIASGIPTMFAMMLREEAFARSLDLTSVTMAMMGSSPLTDALAQGVRSLFPNAVVWNGYGTTESGPFNFGAHPDGVPRPTLSIGYPYPEVEVRLVGPEAPALGVLQVRSPAATAGYLNLPEETAKRVTDGWYDTGDIMRRDEHGFFFFVGRADDMFVCGGENVYPAEVEKLLETHPSVSQAIVVPAPNALKGEIPIAFVVPRAGANVSEQALKAFTLENGPAYRHPRRILFKTVMPLSGPGKIDRKELTLEARAAAESRA